MFRYVRCCLIARMPASVPGRARTRRGSPLAVGGRRKAGDSDRLSDRLERRRLCRQLGKLRGDLGCSLDRRLASLLDPSREPTERPRVVVFRLPGGHEGENRSAVSRSTGWCPSSATSAASVTAWLRLPRSRAPSSSTRGFQGGGAIRTHVRICGDADIRVAGVACSRSEGRLRVHAGRSSPRSGPQAR